MKVLTQFVLIFALLSSCIQHHDIEAEIRGLGNDTLTVEFLPLSQSFDLLLADRDTLYPKNGKFVFDVPKDEAILLIFDPQMARFERIDGGYYRNHAKFIPVIFKPGDRIIIQGELHELYTDFFAKGSLINEQNSLFRQENIEEISEAERITIQIDSLTQSPGNHELIDSLYSQRRQVWLLENEKQIEYIQNNLDSELAAFYLTRQFSETVAKYYPLLPESSRNGIFKNWLNEKLDFYKWEIEIKEAKLKTREGAFAPDFKLESLDGFIVSLSDIKTEYIVLDFWGSWCGPCVAGFPKMKEYYKKYYNRIEFIGIACYDTDEAWKKSVAEHDADWLQLINREKSENDAALSYGVRNFPTKFILDKDRKLLSRSKGEADEFYEMLDELMR